VSALTQARGIVVLSAELGVAAYTALGAARNLRLMTTNGSQSAAGTELTAGGSYVAGGSAITFATPTGQTGTYSALANNNAWSQANMPAATIVGVEIWDTAGTPVRVLWGALTTNKTTALGDTLSFPGSSITAQI
jgi:hypothetical protein